MLALEHIPGFTEALWVPVLLGLHLGEAGDGALKSKNLFLCRKYRAGLGISLKSDDRWLKIAWKVMIDGWKKPEKL